MTADHIKTWEIPVQIECENPYGPDINHYVASSRPRADDDILI